MDRTTSRRIFNEFTSDIDLKRPSGVIDSASIDRYIENALKPLLEEGKAFKRVSVNRNTGIRTTRYSYQGGKKIQDSINTILADMPEALGYKDADAPFKINNLDSNGNTIRHYYNETRERILDPRTASSIKAQALRAGGVSNTDKASGYTTTLVRAGLSGETRLMRQLVDETDRKYLAGQLPSSALAEGASPATITERTKANVNRRANTFEARWSALRNFIDENPDHPFAIEQAMKLKNVTNREERRRVFEAEQTPGTPEFKAAAERRLNKRVANDQAALEWAKKNRRNPIAKAILRNNRNRTAGGRALNRAMSMARFGAIGIIGGVIAAGIGAMLKLFTSILPSMAENVRKMANRGAMLGVTNERLKQFQSLEGRLGGLESGTIGEYLYSVHNKLVDPVTGGDIAGTIGKIAPLNSKLKNNEDLNRRMALYSVGQYTDTLGIDLLDVVLGTSLQGKTLYGDMEWTNALRYNAQTIGRTFGNENIINAMLTALQDPRLISADEQRQIINVAHGKDQKINNTSVKGGKVFDAIMAAIDGDSSSLKPRDTATTVEQKAAEETASQLRNLLTTVKEIGRGILTSILAVLSNILTFVEGIARGVLVNLPGPLKERFAPILASMDEKGYLENKQGISAAEATAAYMKESAIAFSEAYGFAKVKETGPYAQSRGHQLEMQLVEFEKNYFGKATGIPKEFLDREEEFLQLMTMVQYWREKQNEAAKLKAMTESYDTGTKVQYQQRTASGDVKYKDFEYELGNMIDSTVTTNQAAVNASNAVAKAQSAFNTYVEQVAAEPSTGIIGRVLSGYEKIIRNPSVENIRARMERGERVTPEDRRIVESYDNAVAYINKYANDGRTLSGQQIPEGIEDKYRPKEAALSTGKALRSSQEIVAQVAHTLDVIRAQVGEEMYQSIYRGIIENKIHVTGEITAHDRTITVELIDKATGRRITAPVQGIQNMSSRLNIDNISEAFEALCPTRK
jgi:hypothetical protein